MRRNALLCVSFFFGNQLNNIYNFYIHFTKVKRRIKAIYYCILRVNKSGTSQGGICSIFSIKLQRIRDSLPSGQ